MWLRLFNLSLAVFTCTITPIYSPTYIPTDLCTYWSIYLHIYLSTYLPTHLSIYLSTYTSIYLHIYLPTDLSTYTSIYLLIYLPIYLPGNNYFKAAIVPNWRLEKWKSKSNKLLWRDNWLFIFCQNVIENNLAFETHERTNLRSKIFCWNDSFKWAISGLFLIYFTSFTITNISIFTTN